MHVKKKTQIRFTKAPQSKFKTHVSFERVVNNDSNQRGLLHKTVNLKNRFVGDVPSIKNNLHSIKPKTFKGKTALLLAKGSTTAVRTALKVSTKTVLAAENTLFIVKDAIRRKNRFQLHFTRVQMPNGSFKTKAVFDFAENPRARQRGLLHKIVGLKNCVVGDVPSIKSKLHSIKPKTFKGKTALLLAKGSEATVRYTGKKLINTALHTENIALKACDAVKCPVFLYAEQKVYALKYSNDVFRGLFTAGEVIKDVSSMPHKIHKEFREYRRTKKQFHQSKRTIKFTKKSNKKLFNKQKDVFKKQKSEYKIHKKSYKISLKTKTRKLLIKRRKKVFQNQLKDYKRIKKSTKKTKKLYKRDVQAHKKIVKKQKRLITQPWTELTIKKPIRSGWQKIQSADENNDFITAANKGVMIYRQVKKTPQSKLHSDQKKSNKLHSKSSKSQGKLKAQQSKLQNKKYKKKVKKPKKKNKTSTAKEVVKGIKRIILSLNPLHSGFKFILILILVFLLLIFPLIFAIMAFFSSSSNIVSVLGVYPVEDKDIAKAEEYYTNLAWDYNQKILMCSNVDTWRYGLRALGESDAGYIEEPEEFIFGESYRFPEQPVFDYDAETLISFLSAYTYNFGSGDMKYWTFNSTVKNALNDLFNLQYEFAYYYDNTSHWQELYNYDFLGGGGSNSYYTTYADETYKSKLKAMSVPSEIWRYADSNGYIHYNNSTLEVLNAKKSDKRTGYFIQDQRYIVRDLSGYEHKPFFYYNSSTDKFYWIHDGHPKIRSYFGWSNEEQAWWLVPPQDTTLWNNTLENTCLVNFYRKNEWVESCRLYYTVRQKMTLEDACKYLLARKDNANERLGYFYLLKNGSEKLPCLNGGHQCLASPLGGNFESMQSLIYNGYGWDLQDWNTSHCSVKNHRGVDYICAPGSSVYSMIDGKITAINPDKDMITIESTNGIPLWSKRQSVKVTYYNVSVQGHHVGDFVIAGRRIGYSTGHTICDGEVNDSSTKYYIHVTMEIGSKVDSHFLIK